MMPVMQIASISDAKITTMKIISKSSLLRGISVTFKRFAIATFALATRRWRVVLEVASVVDLLVLVITIVERRLLVVEVCVAVVVVAVLVVMMAVVVVVIAVVDGDVVLVVTDVLAAVAVLCSGGGCGYFVPEIMNADASGVTLADSAGEVEGVRVWIRQ